MIAQRFVAPALLVAALLAGCGKKDKDKAPPADPGSGTAVTNTPTPPPPPPPAGSRSGSAAGSGSAGPAAAGDVALPTGDPYKLKDLSAIALPKPSGAPASGNWKDIGDNESDGYGQMNYVDKDDYWYGLTFLDCRAKVVKDAVGMKPEERGALKWCFMQPNDKLKDYPMIKPEKGAARAVKAGNVWVIVTLGLKGKETLKAADVEALLGAIDLAAVAKL